MRNLFLHDKRPRGSRRHERNPWIALFRVWTAFSLIFGGLAMGFVGPQPAAAGPVYLAEVEGEIDLGLSPYLRRVIGEAEREGAAAVVIRINTPGGRLDAALEMKNILLDSPVPTIAFINREAFSAGALIAIATDRIYMAPGSVIGAATPVTGTGETADEKIVSAVRSAFRSVAEARGLDPRVAEAMVDPRVEVPGLVDAASVLTLTTEEAIEWDYARASVADLNALLEEEGLAGRTIVERSPGFAEAVVRFITNPVVASLLISIGFLGILFELQSPGFGLGGAVGLTALALFFGGHLLAGLAGWEGIVLVLIGVILLGLEVFVIPGFGIAGILGILAFLGGFYVSLIGEIPMPGDYTQALFVVSSSLLLMLIGGFLSLRYLPRRAFGGLILTSRLARRLNTSARHGGAGGAELPEIYVSMQGMRGTAITDLHPSGAAEIDGQRVDVVAEEGYVRAGSPVEVIQDDGYRRLVHLVRQEERSGS